MLAAAVDVPGWLVDGLVLGFLASLAAALLFLVGARCFPAARSDDGRLSGDDRRHAEIRRYLRAIEEPYREHATVAGHSVAFFLPARDVAITFDPRAYYVIEATDTRAVLVEHELPGLHIGSRLPFETPDLTAVFPAETDPAAAAFARLGLSPSASIEEVKAAYRERVKEVHPDQGGSADAFRELREAYATARRRSP